MARVRPVEAGPSAFGPFALMAPAWPKLRSKGRAVAAYRRAFAECAGRAAPAERGTERFCKGNQLYKAFAKRCRAERSREPPLFTHPGSVCCLGSSREPCAAN